MRKLICFLLLSVMNLVSFGAETDKLPVMKVYFEGDITADMPYVNGTMTLTDTDDSVVELPAKFRTRGATARQYMCKPSLNIKLRTPDYTEEADSALLGMRSCSSWILDAMAIDRICMRNRVAFDIWNEFSRLPYDTQFGGRNGTEGKFVELYINDQYFGIYCLSDRINRKLLDLKKVQEKEDGSVVIRGALYKSGTQDILNQNEPSYSEDSSACVVAWHDAWELTYPDEYGGLQAWKPLQDAIQNGHDKNYVKKYFFLENLADYHLFIMALCIVDNWGNKNRFLSVRNTTKNIDDSDPTEANRRRFVITPWDLDTSFGGSFDGTLYDGNYTVWPVNVLSKNAPFPISPIISDAEYNKILKQRWIEGRQGPFSIPSVFSKLEKYRNLFILSGAWQRMTNHFDKKRSRPMYVQDLAREISFIEQWYVDRFLEMDDYFGIPRTQELEDGIDKTYKPYQSPESYDLSGRKVNALTKKGIYITNGKKVVL
ncbi:MAG: CotH kinase family protein [Bacteroidaceae bacterium]|nr:CotH kinase family protein [Bacteroidaceae bacterium]